jgi:hypothetical protein
LRQREDNVVEKIRGALGAGMLMAGLLTCLALDVSAQAAEQAERVAASFVLALGRIPTAEETTQWGGAAPLSLADLIARHRSRLEAAPAERRTVLERASRDAFGIAGGVPGTGGPAPTGTYAEMMTEYLRWLDAHPDEYQQVVQRAYRAVLARDAHPIEVDYWRKRPVTSLALLAACLDDWALRNRPGLMATAGVPAVSINSRYLAAVRLSAAVAAEARAVAGVASVGGPSLAAASGRNVVAPGAGEIVSVGGIHFTAAGSAALDVSNGQSRGK